MHETPQLRLTIFRRRQVEIETGLSRSTLYFRIKGGLWPTPIKIGARAVGWLASEVQAMNSARVAGRSDAEIRELVSGLERARITADDPR
jgi:prophage regulatory protein